LQHYFSEANSILREIAITNLCNTDFFTQAVSMKNAVKNKRSSCYNISSNSFEHKGIKVWFLPRAIVTVLNVFILLILTTIPVFKSHFRYVGFSPT